MTTSPTTSTMALIEGHKPITPASGIPVWDIDPYDVELLRDPSAYYAKLRELGEVVYIPRYSVLAVGRYEITRKVFSDHENFLSSRGVGLNDFKLEDPWRPPSIILEVDQPEHTRTRKVMSRALSPKVVKGFADLFRETADTLVDQLLAKGTIEAVTDLAEAFPTTVFPKAVGMKDVNPRHLVDYGAMVFNAVGPDNALRREAMSHAGEIVPWINAACTRDRLTEDGLGAMVYASAEDGTLTEAEAGMLVRSFLSAGVDTTVTGIGNALWCLSQNPEQWQALKRDPSLIRPAFEEVLRYTSPVHTFGRTAGGATEIAGFPVEEGTKVLCVLGAANMDPDKWGDPEVFRIDRKPVGHVAFGAGIHGCVGQNIARGELEAVLGALIEKVDRIEPAGEAVWRPGNAIRALDRLPITLIPN
ncbi:cytochrome P450 [Alloyangia pacifica]|uniref:Cytochrome P450 n=1 Tax=Alloyangia pacifica TaxID=311180 RepID=A0A1I6VFR3_9RHOB|nr:cytochrome P450 [Alloyangia pacifica]SDH96019.1 Cytochrome P450 [Alloyangia pacifica]SFT12588.1 Cytochrome P450 [Alloyangia pacifica]